VTEVHAPRGPRPLAALGLAILCLAPSVARSQTEPDRPSLKAPADTNDWEPYFDLGVAKLRRHPLEAAECFYWAARLAPDRAEPLIARWVAFFLRDQDLWIGYLRGEAAVLRLPEVIRADSLRYRAYLRNPFVHQGLSVLLFEQLPGRFRTDPATRGWIAYAEGDLTTAATLFGEAIAKDSVKNRWVRQLHAGTLVNLGQLDGALAEMQALLRQLRREDSVQVRSYESKELILYSIGLLYGGRGRSAQARDAYRQALVENLAFAPAHRALASLAGHQQDFATAVSELSQAVELDGDDPVLRYEYGNALLAAGNAAEAVPQLRRAAQREPWWADPYFSLGKALESTGAPDQAVAAYRMFVSRAPRTAVMVPTAQGRISALAPR
jgi:tetratricopeptide (TPR) repeat protein